MPALGRSVASISCHSLRVLDQWSGNHSIFPARAEWTKILGKILTLAEKSHLWSFSIFKKYPCSVPTMSNDINSFCHAFLKCFIGNNTNGNEHCLTSRFHLVVRLRPSPRMPRSIRVLFTRAGAKIQNWLEKGARDNKEHGRQAATSAYVFLFHGHINSPGQVPAYGNVRGRINKWFWTKICF